MTDVVERLRDNLGDQFTVGGCQGCYRNVMDEAADEIARLRREKTALVGFVNWIETWATGCASAYSLHAIDGLFGMTRDRIAALRSAIESKPASLDPAVLADLLRLHRCNSDGRQSVGECVDQGQCGCSCGLLLRPATEKGDQS